MSDIPTFEETYNYFVDEGVWLEEQVKIENEAYKRCPLCVKMAASCETLMSRIAATLEICDRELDDAKEGLEQEPVKAYWKNRLAIERQWYDVAKQLVMEMYQNGHDFGVVKAHPDMKRRAARPGDTKMRIPKGSRKTKRKAQKKARQRSRSHSRIG